jgi:hypothetical protein
MKGTYVDIVKNMDIFESFCFKMKKEHALQNSRHTYKFNFKTIRFHKEEFPRNNVNHQGPKKIWVPKTLLTSLV